MRDEELHGHPTVEELIDAVRGFLVDELQPASEGQLRFHARVAANALAIVARELELGAAQAEEHARALEGLGVSSEAELAAAIRGGEFDDCVDEVVQTVRATVRARLEVANPDYLR